MKTPTRSLLFLAIVYAAAPCWGIGDGLNNNELEFTGTISSVIVNGDGLGALFVRIDTLDLRVLVNAKTVLTDPYGVEIVMDDLVAGAAVKVKGQFSSIGILASEVQVFNKQDDDYFRLQGHVTSVQPSTGDTLVALLGVTVVVNSDTKIEWDGVKILVSELKSGMKIQVEGETSGTTWTATSIRVLSDLKKPDTVRFDGIVKEVNLDSDFIQVAVDSVAGNLARVLLTSNTRVVGDLVEGAHVAVKGTLNTDLSVTAKEVRVIALLEIKPEPRKLKVGDTATFTVKLRETAAEEVPVKLKSSDEAVLTVVPASVTIPKGSKVADFTATALKVGTAQITAEALGQKATAQVNVGTISDDDTATPGGEVRVAFAPDHIKMGLSEMRDVVLLIKPPQKTAVEVEFTVKNDLVQVIGERDLSSGAASLKVTVESGSKEGTDSVVAALPKALGGGKAELLVEVAKKGGGADDTTPSPELEFHPDQLKLSVGESRTVKLMLNRVLDKEVTVALTGSDLIAEVASSVVIPAGNKSESATVNGKGEGKVTIVATLPADLGGDTASLEVEVSKSKK